MTVGFSDRRGIPSLALTKVKRSSLYAIGRQPKLMTPRQRIGAMRVKPPQEPAAERRGCAHAASNWKEWKEWRAAENLNPEVRGVQWKLKHAG